MQKYRLSTFCQAVSLHCMFSKIYNILHYRGILKIDTNADTATELNVNLLPQQGYNMWEPCAIALDGCIYFMPHSACCIMKIDPNNNDAYQVSET